MGTKYKSLIFTYARIVSSDTDFYKPMTDPQTNNPLHGITLEMMLTQLVAEYGWEEMGTQINIRCFNHNPSIKSSLAFLRKTPWARNRVEKMYLQLIKK
jgi:uncharacterized protein (DUF2132 family)